MKRVDGFRDWLPEEAVSRRDMETRLRGLLRPAGYQDVQVPLVAPAAGTGGYRLMGDEGQVVVLRSDFTRPVASMAAGSLGSRPRPLRLCYAGPVFRPSEPHAGLPGERWQIGAEVFGATAPEQEVVSLAAAGVHLVATSGTARIVAGDVSLTDRVLCRAGLTGGQREDAARMLRDRDMVTLEAFLGGSVTGRGLAPALMELLVYAGTAGEVRDRWVETGGVPEELEALFGLARGPAVDPVFALGLAPDLPYYTGLVFEIYVGDHPHPVARGGRYDALTRRPGGGETAAGFAWDLDSLLAVVCPGSTRPVYASIH